MPTLSLLLPALLLAFASTAQTLSPLGTWRTADRATVLVYACGSKLCAKIATLPDPIDAKTGKPLTDLQHPQANLRSRPLQGLVILQNLHYVADNRWEDGTVYDPKSGKTYSCSLRLPNANTLLLKGYLGYSFLGRTETWTRAK